MKKFRVTRLTSKEFKQSRYAVMPSSKNDWDTARKKRLEIDGYRCTGANCVAMYHLNVHHIVPRSKGGSNAVSNLRTLCSDCHSKEHKHMLKNKDKKMSKKRFR